MSSVRWCLFAAFVTVSLSDLGCESKVRLQTGPGKMFRARAMARMLYCFGLCAEASSGLVS